MKKSCEYTQFNSPVIYVSNFPFDIKKAEIYPELRRSQIEGCFSEKVRCEKFFAWKLLEKILREADVNIKNISFKKLGERWDCEEFYFSISHTENIVAVAVSNFPVGIDVENSRRELKLAHLQNKLLQENELKLGVGFNKIWTRKEAIFKSKNIDAFSPKDIDTTKEDFLEAEILFGDDLYNVCVAGENLDNATMKVCGEGLQIKSL